MSTESPVLRPVWPVVVATSIALVIAAACLSKPTDEPRPKPAGFTQDPISVIGHGAIWDAGGVEIVPDAAFIDNAQVYYLEVVRASLESDLDGAGIAKTDVEEAEAVIYGMVEDRLLANALMLDWMLERHRPEGFAHLVMVNNALRWYYVLNLQEDPLLPDDSGLWAKGIDPTLAGKLEDFGIETFLATRDGGPEYRDECRKAGVPIPETVMSSDWTHRGVFDGEFISAGAEAELWFWESTDPPGVCLALPRYRVENGQATDDIALLGVICLGTQSNKACFFDNPRTKVFQRGEEPSIAEFVGGADLVENGQGVCSDCHAGENPYIVHPEKPAFQGLTSALMPQGWHVPLVDPSWPLNPGPTNILAAVTSTQKCSSCHTPSYAGRFPDVSTLLPGYCKAVLGGATASPPKRTMPMGGGSIAPYQNDVDALKSSCKAPPSGAGVEVDVDYADDPGHVSPPLVLGPLYQCMTRVAVQGATLDAEVQLFVNGSLVDTIDPARDPAELEFTGLPQLFEGDEVHAMQKVDGTWSGESPKVTVRHHTDDYPNGLPAPEIDPALIYRCAEIIAVRHIPGADVTVFSNGADPVTVSTSTGWSAIRPAKRPFEVGDTFTAQISFCGDPPSGLSAGASAVPEPASIPAARFDPAETYDGQELVHLRDLTHGAKTFVQGSGIGPIGSLETPISWHDNFDVATPLGRPLNLTDSLKAVQKLCAASASSSSTDASSCKQLPAPVIAHPKVGQQFVVVEEAVPGARVRVYDESGDELGDGSGPVIWLNRELTGADTLTVVQQVGECHGLTGYQVSVRNAGSSREEH